MTYDCENCLGRSFKTAAGLKSHKKQKKCGQRRTRSISPSNPFLKFFKKRPKPPLYPLVPEPPASVIHPSKKSQSKRRFTLSDLKITIDVVPNDANRKSPEYRTKIRAHYDGLKTRFPCLTRADYARANSHRLDERSFQRLFITACGSASLFRSVCSKHELFMLALSSKLFLKKVFKCLKMRLSGQSHCSIFYYCIIYRTLA